MVTNKQVVALTGVWPVLDAVFDERMRQIAKWGDQHHDNGFWLAVLGEEFGEVARAMLKQKDGEQSIDIIEELTQCAAVCCAWIEDLTRD